MSQTRKCKYCKQEIDKKATVCPHCQKKQGVGCLTSIIVSIMVFLFVFFGIGIGVSSCAGKMTSENPERNIYTSAKKSVVTTTTDLITTEIITTSTETTSTVLITTTSATTATTTVTTTVTTTTETTTIPETTTTEPPTEPPTLPPTEPPTEPPTPAPTEPPAPVIEEPQPVEQNNDTTYLVNTDSNKFHYPSCRTIKNYDDPHWEERSCDRQQLLDEGYSPCGVCNP